MKQKRIGIGTEAHIMRWRKAANRMAVLIDIPQVAYRTWAIEVHTGDMMRDYELERELEKTLTQYPYSKEHDHVR